MKRKRSDDIDSGTWMNTYSDLVTLLLTFFVLLFSFSSVNEEKWEAFVKALVHSGEDTAQIVLDSPQIDENADGLFPGQAPGQKVEDGKVITTDEPLPVDFDELYLYLQKYMDENGLQSSVQVMKNGDGVVYIRFQNDIFFDPDEYYLRPSAYEILDYIGDGLYSVQDEIYVISINGHTAQVQDPNYAISDWMLSSERASSVAIYLDDEKGIDPQKLRPMGYGKNYPIASNDTREGREKNRRVDMTIVKKDANLQDGEIDKALGSLFDPSQFPRYGDTEDILSPDDAADGAEISSTEVTEPVEETPPPTDEPSAPSVTE